LRTLQSMASHTLWRRAARAVLLLFVVSAALIASQAHSQPAATLQPFKTSFSVEWKGISAGTAWLELTQSGPNQYHYVSRNNARGIFRLAFPEEITQTSDFVFENGAVRPLRYRADDGSSDKSRDISLDFDWTRNRVRGTAEKKPVDLEAPAGLQDGMSVQIALMVDLAAGRSPSTYWMIDKNKLKDYEYRNDGKVRIRTALGELDTVIWSSRRPNSDRITRVWYAPSLGYAPVKAERLKAGKVEIAMTLKSLAR
jgi:Protein of unknown function (DUF3108)